MKYVIVKHAAPEYWSYYFEKDPVKHGVSMTQSAHNTFTGKEVGIKKFYTDETEANKDCQRMNIFNPAGYAVCKINKEL